MSEVTKTTHIYEGGKHSETYYHTIDLGNSAEFMGDKGAQG